MNTASLVSSVSRRAGGLFESVRRLHQELCKNTEPPPGQQPHSGQGKNESVKVSVLGLQDAFTKLDLKAWYPVPVQTFRVCGPSAFGYARGLSSGLTAINPDLVHVHGLWQYQSVLAGAWSRKSRKPYLVSAHGMLDPWALRHSVWKKRLAWFAYEGRHLTACGCIRALCRAEADSIRALGLGVPICIIHNGVDLPCKGKDSTESEPWESETTSETSDARIQELAVGALAREGKVLLYLGRLHPKKGICNLLRAWRKARRTEDWILAIAGWDQDGHEAELKALASELGIIWAGALTKSSMGASVVFLGPQFGRSKREWFKRCHAFILPSLSEGLPMAVLEAWAYAKPVLITPQCNLPEGFEGDAAIRIQPSEAGIIAGLEDLFRARSDTLQSIGARGQRLAATRFAWSGAASEMRAVYFWMIGAGPQPNCVETP